MAIPYVLPFAMMQRPGSTEPRLRFSLFIYNDVNGTDGHIEIHSNGTNYVQDGHVQNVIAGATINCYVMWFSYEQAGKVYYYDFKGTWVDTYYSIGNTIQSLPYDRTFKADAPVGVIIMGALMVYGIKDSVNVLLVSDIIHAVV
jgi:hypothetical protein